MRVALTPVLFFSIVLGACSGIPVASTGGATTTTRPTTTGSVAGDVVAFTNDARRRNGLAALVTSPRLMEAARLHAQQMAQYQRAEHTIDGAKYPTMLSRLQAVEYPYMTAAENVAWNQRDAQAVVNSWMASTGHRHNILDPALREIGAAMARSSNGEPYWIQVFGTPR
jgi:uncharacterized protein YkwD